MKRCIYRLFRFIFIKCAGGQLNCRISDSSGINKDGWGGNVDESGSIPSNV